MRTFKVVAAMLVLSMCCGLLRADIPNLQNMGKIKDGGIDLKVAYDSIPFVVDWDNDGAKDLLVGQYTQGYIWLYLNQGTNLNPVFNGGVQVQSSGTPITVTYG